MPGEGEIEVVCVLACVGLVVLAVRGVGWVRGKFGSMGCLVLGLDFRGPGGL